MPTEVPLRLKIDPGSYRCTWLVPGADEETMRLTGDLELEPDRPPTGAVYGEVPMVWKHENGESSAEFPQRSTYPYLRAELVNGLEALLLDATLTVFGPDRAFVDGRVALVGAEAALKESVYGAITVQLGGLDVVSGIGPLKKFTFPTGSMENYLAGAWTVEGEPESMQEWSSDEISLSLEFDGSFDLGNPFGYRMSFSPVVRMRSLSLLSVDEWVERWVEPMRRIVCLATGKREPITYLSVSMAEENDPGGRREAQVYGSGLHQKPYSSEYSGIRNARPAFTLKADDLSLLTMLEKWQTHAAGHHPLLETYGSSVVTPQQHPRARYLLLIQALEGLHGHENAAELEIQAKNHEGKRNKVLSAVQYSLYREGQKFLKKYVMKRPPGSLDACLRSLFKSLPIDVTEQLDQTPIIANLTPASDGKPQDAANALRIIRNDLSHGTKSYDTMQIKSVADILERVARAHLLRLLGGGLDVQRRVLAPD